MRISDWSSDVCSSDLRPVQTVEAFWLQDRPVYRLVYESTAWLVDAANGKSVLVDSVIASGIAAEDYAGNGVASEPEWMTVATLEVRDHEAPIWRVPFEDGEGTTLYVSGQDRSEEHTSELQSLMRISYAVFCLKKKKNMQLKVDSDNTTQNKVMI